MAFWHLQSSWTLGAREKFYLSSLREVFQEVVETGAMTSPRAFVGLALLDGAIWAFGGGGR